MSPNRSAARLTACVTCCSSVTSARQPSRRPDAVPNSDRILSRDFSSTSMMKTDRPISSSRLPVALPMPPAPPITADVTEEAPVKALFASALSAHGRLDILVNDVGGGTSGHIWEAKVEDWDFIMRLNLRSAFLCTREAAAHMRERRSGRIVN